MPPRVTATATAGVRRTDHGCRCPLKRTECRPTYNFLFCIKGLAMPIYAYRCTACGHAKDVLQKLSDPVLSTCPACGAEAFAKQLTAAGFQLKGSGWYVTDFKGGAAAPAPAGAAAASDAPKADGGSPPAAAPATAPAPAPAPAAAASSGGGGSCGGPCACH
jgi:putative FmdB family regulatory protein